MSNHSQPQKIKGKVLISLLTKNSTSFLPYVLKNVELYANLFEDYYCLIVDGFSTDNTYLIAKSWIKSDPLKRYFTTQPSSNLPRGDSLNEARNFVIDFLKPQFGEDVYLLLLDSDSPNVVPFDTQGFLTAFNSSNVPNWSALFCNQKNNKYYDILALRDSTLDENYQLKYRKLSWHNGSMQNALKKYETTKTDPSGFYPVESAFSGAGLYKTVDIKDAKYQCSKEWLNPDDNKVYKVFECEHVPFHKDIIKNGGKLYINCNWFIGEHK